MVRFGGPAPAARYPESVRRTRILVIVMLAVLLTGCTRAGDPIDLPPPIEFETQISDQINNLRSAEGLPRLELNECMANHARERAVALPGAADVPRGELPADCGDFDYAGENVSRSDQSADEVVATWAASELQLPNLVDPKFEQMGVGCLGVSAVDTTRIVRDDEQQAGMVCSVIFQGYAD